VRSVERAGVKGWWLAWWGLLVVWPLPVYFLPLLVAKLNAGSLSGGASTYDDALGGRISGIMQRVEGGMPYLGRGVSVTVLLAVLAAHKVFLTCAESVFAHMITKTPVLDSLSAPPDGPDDTAADAGDVDGGGVERDC
jgi:hypothetical protein